MAEAYSSSDEDSEDEFIVMEGWMMKQGGWMKSWSRRYFSLTRDQKLTYYEDKEKKKRKGDINLQHVTEVTTASYPDNCIVLIGKQLKRDFHIQTRTGKRKKWMDAIKNISSGRGMPKKKKKKPKKKLQSTPVGVGIIPAQPIVQPFVQPVNVLMRAHSAPPALSAGSMVVSPVSTVQYFPVQQVYAPQPMYASAQMIPAPQPAYIQPQYPAQVPLQHQPRSNPLPSAPSYHGSVAAPARLSREYAYSRAEGEPGGRKYHEGTSTNR